ncbi:hypothetical protein [Roseospira navarrensis]|uniref:Uncharacterized protein n=1 Tax=Roseospira navarrensis TaxID=140058 RepID=A0A7X1ZH49_9PROT|nr:hypothetical protein [Roseospira navarrensis]MQX38262.1 hypothetical protein [Roseospira navarrensis]
MAPDAPDDDADDDADDAHHDDDAAPDERPAPPADPGPTVRPDTDRRRDLRATPWILDLGSVQEADGAPEGGWTQTVGTDGSTRPGAAASPYGADWTAVVAPHLTDPDDRDA